MAKNRVGIAGRSVVTDEERAVETAVGILHHRKGLAIAEDYPHVGGQLVEQQVAHRAVRVVDEYLSRAAGARALDRGTHFGRIETAVDFVFGMGRARVDLLPSADAGDALHIARYIEPHAGVSAAAAMRVAARKARRIVG